MIISLYRSLLKESSRLPDPNTSVFYRSKIKALFRSDTVPESSAKAVSRIKYSQKLLRHLQAANDGYVHAIDRVLHHTYARRGAGKHGQLKAFTLADGASSSVPHAFSPALAALVTSSISHNTNSPSAAALLTPPTLPPRANPNSEEARLLGPLSKGRINRIRLRFWNDQVGKLKAPIAVILKSSINETSDISAEERQVIIEKAGLTGGVRENRRMLDEIEFKSRVEDGRVPRLPRRLQVSPIVQPILPLPSTFTIPPRSAEPRILPPSSSTIRWHFPKTITARLLRRRYQLLLIESPIVTISLTRTKGSPPDSPDGSATKEELEKSRVQFNISNSEWARGGTSTLPIVSEEDLWWIENDGEKGATDEKKGKRRR